MNSILGEERAIKPGSVCDFCSTGFSCSRLSMALKILEADEAVKSDPKALACIGEVKRYLAATRWDFNSGGIRPCALAGRTEEVRAMTDRLIALLPVTKNAKVARAQRALAGLPESLVDEEYRCD